MQHKICVNQTCYVIIKASGQQEAININFVGISSSTWIFGCMVVNTGNPLHRSRVSCTSRRREGISLGHWNVTGSQSREGTKGSERRDQPAQAEASGK